MLVFGKNVVYLNSQKLNTAICPICRTQGSIILSIIREHGHLYWIPVFPFKKKAIFDCWHCKNAFTTAQMPSQYAMQAENMALSARGPIWQYSGIFLIAIIIAWGFHMEGKIQNREAQYLDFPLQGDIYVYKNKSDNYSTFKITEISNDSFFVNYNNLEIGKSYKIDKIDKPMNYSESVYGISKIEVIDMYETGQITKVKREKIEK